MARNDLRSFFERSEALKDHSKLALAGTPQEAKIVEGMKKKRSLSLAHDLAIKIKHAKQDSRPWAGEVGGDLVSQSVNVFAGTGKSAHDWEVTFTPTGAGPNGKETIDALELARAVVADWRSLLVQVGLLTTT